MEKEYMELQGCIDAIITTAKLLDYKISIDPIFNLTIISKDEFPFMTITLRQKTNTILLTSQCKGSGTKFEHEPHEEKVDHLKVLLQKL